MGRRRPSTYIEASSLDPHATPPPIMGFKTWQGDGDKWVVIDFRKRAPRGLCLLRLSAPAAQRIGFPGAVFCLRSYVPNFWSIIGRSMWLSSESSIGFYSIKGADGQEGRSRTVLLCGRYLSQGEGNWLVRPDEVEVWGNAIGYIEHLSKNHRTWQGVVRDFPLDQNQDANTIPRGLARHANRISYKEVAR